MMKKLRFKNNNKQYPEPRLVKLSEVLVEGSKVKVYDTNKYKKITVMLNLKGLKFAEIDRDMADTRPFYQRRTNEIIIGKQNYFNGSIAIVSDEFNDAICSNAIMSFSSKQNNPFFLFSLLSQDSFMKQREKLANGTGQKELSENDFLSFEIKLPVIDEQEKIGGFLRTIDKLIQKQQDKIGLLKELKKGYLQKMFPKNDANVPEIRFKGFTDAWEQRKLGDMAKSFEYGLNASAMEYDGINKYIRITDIDEDTRLFKTSDLTSPNIEYNGSDNYLLKKGDILFARTGASVGKSYIFRENDGKVYFAGFLIRARIKSNYSPKFIYQTTLRDEYRKKIMITSQRSGQPGVNAKEYSSFEFMIPSYEEQMKIGEHLEKIDHLITLHQRKLDQLETLKKGYMQRLFA